MKSYCKNLQRPSEDVETKRLEDRLSYGTLAKSEGSKPVLGTYNARLGQEKLRIHRLELRQTLKSSIKTKTKICLELK